MSVTIANPYIAPLSAPAAVPTIRTPRRMPRGLRGMGDDESAWGKTWPNLVNIFAQIGANVTNQKLAQSAYQNQIAQYMRYQQAYGYGQQSSPGYPQTSILPGISNTALIGGALALGLIIVLAMR